MINYRSFSDTLFQILFINPHVEPTVKVQHLHKLVELMDKIIPHHDANPLSYIEAIEEVLPKELSALSSDQIKVAINLLSVSRHPPSPTKRRENPLVNICVLLVNNEILTADQINEALDGTDISGTVAAALAGEKDGD